jgi:aspartate kinase
LLSFPNNAYYHSLLEVYKKLREISAATSAEATQNELLDEARVVIQEISNDHVSAVQSFIKDPELQKKVSADIENDCQELVDYIIAAKRFNLEVNARSKDRVVSFGEKLSCRFMTYLLKDRVSCTRWKCRWSFDLRR